MKCLSIQNPWAPLICAGVKDVENRTWKTDYRGPLLIHTSGQPHKWINQGNMPKAFQKKHDALLEVPLFKYPLSHLRYEQLLERINEQHYKLSNSIPDDADPAELTRELDRAAQKYGPAFPSRCIIGKVDLVDCVRDTQSEWSEPYQWNWVFENPVYFEKPILEIKGKLKLWDFDLPGEYL
jgi:hypothetical protein